MKSPCETGFEGVPARLQASLNSEMASEVSVMTDSGISLPSSRKKIPSPAGLVVGEIGIYYYKYYRSMPSFPIFTFNSLYDILASFQTGCCYYFSFPPNVDYSKQATIMEFYSHLLLVLVPTFYPLQFCTFRIPFLYMKLCPCINKRFSSDSFLDWEGHHWVFISRHPTHYNIFVFTC